MTVAGEAAIMFSVVLYPATVVWASFLLCTFVRPKQKTLLGPHLCTPSLDYVSLSRVGISYLPRA